MIPLRILHTESSTGLGGQELRILSEAVGMAKRGHTVILALPPNSNLKDLADREGLGVESLSQHMSLFVPLIIRFLYLIQKHRIQILNTHGSVDSWTASIAGRLSRQKPIIIRSRHKSTRFSRNFRHKVLYQILPHAIVTTGEAVRKLFITEYGLDATKVFSIPTGVDLGIYRPAPSDAAIRTQFGVSIQHVLVGTVAFLRGYKGLDHFVEAAKVVRQNHPEARFLIVGNGPDEIRLRQKIKDLDMSDYVILAGFREDIARILAAIDVFVLPSTGGEGLPQALTQAMAMARPVVATMVGSVPEVVKHQATGLLVPPGDVKQLAQNVNLLIQDRALREKMAQAGRELVVKCYSRETMLDQTEDLYARLLERRLSATPA